MDKQSGGAKLKPDSINSPGFTPVYDMIIADNSKLSVLNTNSLKGFMINLKVDANDSKYLNLAGTKFTRPVTSFILKFVILRGAYDFEDLDDYKGVHKSFETRESFFEETKLQQYIWKRSITAGRPAICPSVANLSMFDTINSARLMWFLTKKATQVSTASVFDFLFNNSKINGRGIGILTMPAITQSATLTDFTNIPNNTDFFGVVITRNVQLYVISHVFAQIVRLFIEIGVIHFDLHPGNVMVYLNSDKKITTSLIDFGRASNIMSDEPDGIFYKSKNEESNDRYIAKKREIRAKKQEFNNKFLKNHRADITGIYKHTYMQDVLSYIADTEYDINNPLYFRDNVTYQMQWYEQFTKNYPEVFVSAFNILDDMSRINVNRTGINPGTIQEYERNGSFINLDNPEGINSFIVPYPGPTRQLLPPVPRVFLPPSVPIEPVETSDSSVSMEPVETTESSVSMEPVETSESSVSMEPVETTESSASMEPLLPPIPPVANDSLKQGAPSSQDNKRSRAEINSSPTSLSPDNKRARESGGRKNKLHKTNKRKIGKSKRNRHNKNKNTRKKRKIEKI